MILNLTRDKLAEFEERFEALWKQPNVAATCVAQTNLLGWIVDNPRAVRAMITYADYRLMEKLKSKP